MTLLNVSRTVAVRVRAVLPATDENVVDAAVGLTVTAAVWVMPPPPSPVVAVAEIVLACAVVELSLVVNTPRALDEPLAAGLNPLFKPVELTVTVAPLITLLN